MTRLRMHEEYVVAAREDLLTHDLIAYDPPLTQLANRTRLAWFHDQESVKESDQGTNDFRYVPFDRTKPRRDAGIAGMTVFLNHFTKAHLFVFVGIWLSFTALTYWIAEHGIDQYDHRRLVILTSLGTILGPMTGAISRNCQSCCLAFSLSLLPYCGAFLVGGTLPLFIKLPFQWGASALRMAMWIVGLLGWFLGGIMSYGHALN